ncbi:MAG: hypothetical protein WCJ17_00525 [bacterium]
MRMLNIVRVMSCLLLGSMGVWMPTHMFAAADVAPPQTTPLSYAVPDAVRAAGFGTAAVLSGASFASEVVDMKDTFKALKSKRIALAKLTANPRADVSEQEALAAEIKQLKNRLLRGALLCGGSLGLFLSCGSGSLDYGKSAYKISKAEKGSDRSLWSNRQKQSILSQIFSKKPFMERSHTSFVPGGLEGGLLAAPGLTPNGTTSDYLEDLDQRFVARYDSHLNASTKRVHVILGSSEAGALAAESGRAAQNAHYMAARLSPGLTALGIAGDERSGIMQRVSGQVLSMSASQAKAHIDSVLQQLAEASNVTNLDELIEAEVKKRKAAAVPYTL